VTSYSQALRHQTMSNSKFNQGANKAIKHLTKAQTTSHTSTDPSSIVNTVTDDSLKETTQSTKSLDEGNGILRPGIDHPYRCYLRFFQAIALEDTRNDQHQNFVYKAFKEFYKANAAVSWFRDLKKKPGFLPLSFNA
jgi:hypothetical protein